MVPRDRTASWLAPRDSGNALHRYAPVAVAFLLLAFFAQGYFSGLQKSLTWDAPLSIGGGYAILAWGDYDVYRGSPPLMQVLSAWSLYRSGPREPDEARWRASVNPKLQLGVELTYLGGWTPERVAARARLPGLLLGTLLVGLIYAWGRALLGIRAGLAVTLLAAFSPNLIAHSWVVAADLGCTVFMFAAVAAFWWASRTGALGRWFLCGTFTGLALISKFTALLLGPIFVMLVCTVWLTRPETRDVRWLARAAVPISAMSWLVIAVAYGFDLDLSFYRDGVSSIYPEFNSLSYTYLLGVPSVTPVWYYYLVAYVLKVPVPVLVLLLMASVGLVGGLWKQMGDAKGGHAGAGALESIELENLLFVLIPPAAVIGVAFFDPANVGLRRILPALPFLLLFAGYAVRRAKSRSAHAVVASLLVWAVVAGAWIYPHHLSFFNVAAGGPEQGAYLLDDSNIDWGQDLPALAAWQSTRPETEELRFRYFGTADWRAYGVRAVRFDMADVTAPRPGTYAISVTELTAFRKLIVSGAPAIDWLTAFEPTARAGHSIYIYEFR